MAHERIKRALAENTAYMRVIADRYVHVLAKAELEIKEEQSSQNPSPWKIKALENIRDRAEENIARFKAGPDRLPKWLHEPKRKDMV